MHHLLSILADVVPPEPDSPEIAISFLLFLVAFGIAAFAFWIWMLVDAIRNPGLSSDLRIIWVLVIVLVGALGALIYFFAGRNTRRTAYDEDF